MTATEAHQLAEEYAGIKNDDATVTPMSEGIYKVELTSDVTIYVNPDGDCERA